MVRTNLNVPRSLFVGFEGLFDELERIHTSARSGSDNYPPHNIVKESDTEYVIEVAVAGFSEDDLDVEQKERSVIISGEHKAKDRDVIHRGISTKKFKRTFRLSEYVLVDGASLKDGILAIKLKLELPEEKRPRKINIS